MIVTLSEHKLHKTLDFVPFTAASQGPEQCLGQRRCLIFDGEEINVSNGQVKIKHLRRKLKRNGKKSVMGISAG